MMKLQNHSVYRVVHLRANLPRTFSAEYQSPAAASAACRSRERTGRTSRGNELPPWRACAYPDETRAQAVSIRERIKQAKKRVKD